MKALTVRQPYAALIVAGMKTVETRSWSATHRGRIAIHAGQVVDDDVELAICDFTAKQLIPMPIGAVIATARLVDVVPMYEVDTEHDRSGPHIQTCSVNGCVLHPLYRDRDCEWPLDTQARFGTYKHGFFGWLLTDIEPIDPYFCSGQQGLWDLEGVNL